MIAAYLPLIASPAPSHSHSSKTTCPIPLDALYRDTSQPTFSQTTVSTDTLEFLQRPNSGDELPVAAPIEPLGGGDPAPDTEPVKAPEHHHAQEEKKDAPAKEQTPAPESTPKPAQEEPKSNGAPVESKPEDSQTADMSYADMAAKGPKQSDEEK